MPKTSLFIRNLNDIKKEDFEVGELKCQCPARVADFISTFVIVVTLCGQTIQGTLVNATNDHLEIEAGTDTRIVFCCHICSVTQPGALG